MPSLIIKKVQLLPAIKIAYAVRLSEHMAVLQNRSPAAMMVVKMFTLMMISSELAGSFVDELVDQGYGEGKPWTVARKFAEDLVLGEYDAQYRTEEFQKQFNAVMEPLLEALQLKYDLSDDEIINIVLSALP